MADNFRVEFKLDPSAVLGIYRDLQDRATSLSGEKGGAARWYSRAALIMYRDTMRHFQAEQDSESQPWVPRKKRYDDKVKGYTAKREKSRTAAQSVLARSKGATGSKLLQGAGILRGSLLWEGGTDSARVYSDLIYSAVHQYGFPGPDRLGRMLNIPKREYLYFTPQCLNEIEVDMARWLVS